MIRFRAAARAACMAVALTGFAFATGQSLAQAYPTKPIRYLVGFTPGTATDIVARMVSQKLTERWGQQVIVDNRVGAAGTIAVATAARSAPDGHTLYMASSTMVVSPYFIPNVSYDIFKDFDPVILMVSLPTVMIVPPQLKLGSVRDFIALAKAKPRQLNYAHSGRGTGSHVGAEMLSALAGIELTEISFKSSTDALNGVIQGEIAVYFPNLAAAMPMIKQGRVKALAVSTAKRSPVTPDIPGMSESLPGFDTAAFYGIVVPARTPRPVISKLNAEVTSILDLPDIRERLTGLGAEVIAGAPATLTARMKTEQEQVVKVVRRIEVKEGKR
ncbi:MAG TPA: tripartite tricarboxylate transporter substrate binding protein [Burkholderiales bacterium]|nr:tripartite tricarboxylate transporter substrate binding protein [Burkholderiales bacterium]